MSEGDLLADRKRLKRSLSGWRAIAIVALFCTLAYAAQMYTGGMKKAPSISRGYIAQITVDGVMMDDEKRDKILNDIAEDDSAKALLVRFNSPGGTTVGGEELYLELRKVAKKKPVIGVMRTLCASACYMASLGTDRVIARESTLTGSIGVLLQSAELSEMAKKLGITPITIKSGKFKDVPSLTDPFTDEERQVVGAVVMDAYDQFVNMIVAHRGLTKEQVLPLADGRIYTGRQAAALKLIDGLGGMDEAKQWLITTKKLDKDIDIKEMDKEPQLDSLFAKLTQWTNVKFLGSMTVGLDGLISIWQHSAL